MRALLIEDDTTTIKVIKKRLELLGFEVDFAENGNDSINYYRTRKYEIIIVDLEFPGKDVFEILLELNISLKDSYIIIYSSNLDSCSLELLSKYKIYKALDKEAGHESLFKCILDIKALLNT